MQSDTRHFILLCCWSFFIFATTGQHLQPLALPNEDADPACLQADDGRVFIQRHSRERAAHLTTKISEEAVEEEHLEGKSDSSKNDSTNKATTFAKSALAEDAVLVHNTSQAQSSNVNLTLADHLKQGAKHYSKTQTVAAVIVSAVMLLVLVLLVLEWSSSSCTKGPQSSQLIHLDNAQVLAQFLVVYSNIFYSNVTPFWGEPKTGATDWQTWLYDSNNLLKALGDGFNTVCVPMMCFIVGVLSQGPTTESRIRQFVQTLVVPTLIWVFFAKPVVYDSMMEGSTEVLFTRLVNAFQFNTLHQEWWLQSLLLWQASAFTIWSHFRPRVSLTLMLAFSAVAGYLDLNGNFWALRLDSVFGFLPYFGIGYLLPFDAACRLTDRLRLPIIMAVGLVILWVFAIIPLAGALPSSQGNYECCTAGGIFKEMQATNGKGYKLYWTRRLARVALDMPPVLMLVFYVVPRKLTPLSWIGKHYLYPFLFHALANHWRSELVRFVEPPVVASTGGHIAVLLFHVPYAIGSMIFFASWPWRVLFSWCFQPTWLETLISSTGKQDQESMPLSKDLLYRAPSYERVKKKKSVTPPLEILPAADAPASPSDRDDQQSPTTSLQKANEQAQPDPETEFHVVHKPKMWQSAGAELVWQAPARKYYKWLWVVWAFRVAQFLICAAIFFWVWPTADNIFLIVEKMPSWFIYACFITLLACTPANYLYHYFRLRDTDQLPKLTNTSPLQHAVVVVAYKEPIEVLMRTVRTIIGQRGIGHKPMIVFASEDRDPTAQESFQSLSREAGDSVDLFLLTKHKLTEGETVGKSSNENWAVQQLYQLLVEEQDRDPFEILVTIVDADSLLSDTYLAQAEASFRRQCDGRRLIYSGPLNVYRNFAEANIFVQAYELNRCHGDVFHNPFVQYSPQSNYSLTLGFAHELEFWTPDLMPEDIHTSNRAMINNFGSQTCVAIPSFICNDLVTDFGDRYTQALRHQFGSVTEFAWGMAMFLDNPKISFQLWWSMFRRELSRDGSFLTVATDCSTFTLSWVLMISAYCYWPDMTWKCKSCAIMLVICKAWRFLWFWVGELTLWQTLLKQFPIQHPSVGRWFLIILLFPFFMLVGDVLFYMGATIHSVIRITTIGELTYVAAPKGDGKQPANIDPEKAEDQKQ